MLGSLLGAGRLQVEAMAMSTTRIHWLQKGDLLATEELRFA